MLRTVFRVMAFVVGCIALTGTMFAKSSSSVTVTSSLNPSTYGNSVTFTAAVTPSAATGTVTFKNGSTTLGTGTISSGKATWTTTTLPAGSNSITGVYSGDNNYNGSTSAALTQTVNKAPLTVTANNASRAYGVANPTFTCTLSGFVNGDTQSVVSGACSATTTATTSSAPGTYTITAAVGTLSAANYTFSTFVNGTLTITKATPTIILNSSPNPSEYGASVTFTATLTPTTPTGIVTFMDGGTALGTGTISAGSATYSTSVLAVGSHSISAVYGGDSNYSGSSSSVLTQTINSGPQVVTTSLSSGTAGTSYSATLAATGGTAPYTWSISTGSLPTGLSLTASAGTIGGTPAVGGTSNFAVQVTDANNVTTTQPLSIVIAPVITGLGPVLGLVGTNVTISGLGFGASQGTSTVTFNGAAATTIANWTTTSIIAVVPAGATTGNVVVTVGGVSSNSSAFTVTTAYLNGYQYRRTITVGHENVPNTDQTDFPVLISGVYSFLATVSNGGFVQSPSGYDIVFSQDPEGASILNHEIDSYDPVHGTASFWVMIPTLSHTVDTVIYLFYGNPSVTVSQENKPGVWQNGYAGVWHFGSSTNLNTNDSTANANNGTNYGVTPAAGMFGGAGSFNGTGNSYLDIPSSTSFKPATLTLEAWVNMAGPTTYPDIFSLDYRADGSWNPPYQAYALDFYSNTLEPRLDVAVTGIQVAPNGPDSIAAGQWTHVAGTYDGSNMIIYTDGSPVEEIAQDGPISYGTSQDLDIGTRSPYTSAEAVNGLIDEARISTVARSADWIATEYANQSSPSMFYAVDGQETPSTPPSIQFLSPAEGTIGELVAIQGYGFQAAQGASTVMFNGLAATPTSWTDASIVVPVPAGATTGNVVVTVGGVASNAVAFSVYAGYGGGYQYRRAIVLSHAKVPNTDQTDFPALISGVYSYLASVNNGGSVQNANGYDIIFSQDPEGASKLDHEIDSYNSVTGTASFWVRIPTLSHTVDTVIYLFYGNPSVTVSQENKAGVWRNNYLSVYHLGNGTTVGPNDSGSAGYTLAGSASAVSGKIGGGAAFNGSPATYLYNDSLPAYPTGSSPVTLETWVQLASSTGGEEILGYGANSANGSRDGLWWDGSNAIMEFENLGVSGPMPFDNNWHHLVGVYGGGALSTATDQLYLDGAPLSTSTSGGWPDITTTEFKIGGIPTVTSCCALNGSVDEVRVSSGVRSSDWVATEYANQSSPSTFYTVEGQATTSGAPTIQVLSPAAAAIGAVITIQGAGFQPTQGGSTVTFNGAVATPTSWNDANIVVPVPAAATTGSVNVTVGGVSSNGATFTVVPTPSITNLNPTSGAVGTLVTITGTSFGSVQGTSTVTFAGTVATPSNWTGSTITVPVPAGATTGNVIVTVGGGASNPVGFAVTPALSITSISPSSGMVGTYVTITGTLFGATQGTSTVALNTANATVASWSDTSITAIVPAGAVSGPFSVSVNGQVATSSSFTVTSLPSPWVDTDLGSVSQAGSATFSGGTFTVLGGQSGTGNAGLWGTADGMNFVYQTLSGDGSIVARLTSLQAGVAGVMIRETLNPAATDVYVISSFGKVFIGGRPTTGASANAQGYGTSGFPPPVWLQVVREGSIFTGNVSSDGVNWTNLGSMTISMAQTVDIGLAVSGYDSPATATFDSVSINSAATTAPVITGLSPTTASVGSQVQIIGTGFGDTQGGSVLLLNDTPMQVTLWGNTGIVFTVPAGAASGPLVVSVAPSMNDSNAVNLEVTTQPLPTSWMNQDVGAVGTLTGSSSFSRGIFTVTGGGANIGGTADAMQFAYQTLTGDGSMVARLTNDQAAQAGVMMRETMDSGAADAYIFFQGGLYNENYIYDRPSTGAQVVYDGQPYGFAGSIPEWMEMTRVGSTFTGYISPDGVNWTQIGSATVSMAETIYVGLMVSGGGSLGSATFDSVSINSAAASAPTITGLSATTASVGSQVEISGNNFGEAQAASVLLMNGTSMPVNLWSNTSIVFTIPMGTTSGQLVVSVAPSMNDSNPVYLEITGQPLPTPWLNQDVGAVGTQMGSSSFSGGVFTATGGGGGAGGTADAMQFLYQSLPGDGSIIARLTNYQATQAGVMIRETPNPGATDAYMFYLGYPYTANFMYDRPSTGAQVVYDGQPYGFAGSVPEWMELTRVGSTLTGYISSDGVNWTQIGSATVSMAQTVYIGLMVGGGGSVGTATFDNVSVNIGTTPFISSVAPIVGTIGTSVTITGSNFGSTQGTSTVKFSGVQAATTSWSNLQIVATVPSGVPVGTGPVTVTVNSITSPSTSSSLFTVVNPVIASVAPPAGPVGGTLVINGSGFGASQNGVVSINGVTANVSYTCPGNYYGICWTDTQIQVTVPNTSNGPLTVSNDGIVSNSVAFTVTNPPVITSLSPATGEPTTVITIGGSSFGATQSSSTVAVGGVPAAVTSWSDGQIVATVPYIAMNGPVTVTVAGITAQGPLFIYNAINQLTASNGAVTTYSSGNYGGAWLLYSSAGPGCSTCSMRGNIVNTYDDNANLLTTTDANGNTVSYTYDGNNNMTSKTAQLNGQPVTTSYTYNNLAEVLSMTDALGNTTINTYDGHGNLLTVATPAPNGQTPPSVTQFAYNTLGELTQILDPLNHATTISYYPTGLIQSITDAQNNITSYAYDSRGNRTSVIDPINGSAHPTTFAYDAMSRLTGITYPDGTTAGFAYDGRGRRISATDQNNKKTVYAYDDADRLISVTDPAGNLTQYNYDTEDNLISITDANNHTTSFAYDTMGRVIQTTFPSTLTETYTYDQLYNLTSKTDRKSQTIQYVYDSLYRMIGKTYPDQTSASYAYDLVGKIQGVTDPTGSYGFAYDNMGRLIGTSTQYTFLPGHNFQNSYTYDAASNRTSLTAPDGSTNSYVYDTLNRLSGLTNSLTGQFGFGYDALSRRTQLTRPNGVNTNYNYDSVSHLLSVLHQAGSTTLDGAGYTYDYAGNRTSKTNYLNGITSNYGYDAIYELQQVTQGGGTTESYTYDAVGNRLSSSGVPTYSYNPSNELTSNSSGSYTYDNNGNTLSDASGKSYTWDFDNRVVSAVVPGAGTVTFKYDPLGRRIQKSSTLGTTNYLYDGRSLLEEADQNGNVLARYTQGRNIDETLSELRSATTSYYEQDGLSSVSSLSNPAAVLTNTYTYDSFGQLTASTGTLANPLQYTGREFDPETGNYYYRARRYDPSVGRFLSEDPIRFAPFIAGAKGAGNFYSYVANSPLDYVDPSGLQGTKIIDCAPNNPACQSQQSKQSWLDQGYAPIRQWIVRHTVSCQPFCRENCNDGLGDCEWRTRNLWCPYLSFKSCSNSFYDCSATWTKCNKDCNNLPTNCFPHPNSVTGPIGTAVICN